MRRWALGWCVCLWAAAWNGCGDPAPTTQPAGGSSGPAAPELAAGNSPEEHELVDPSGFPGRTHWVQPGETLYSIARRYYGDEKLWRKIYYANDRRLTDPDNIPVGIKLIVPP